MEFKKLQHMLLVGCLAFFSGVQPARAALLDLPDFPLYLAQSVDPNVFLEVDDSGSMDWELMTERHFSHCGYNFEVPGNPGANGDWECGFWDDTGLSFQIVQNLNNYTVFYYAFPAGDHVYNAGFRCTVWWDTSGNLSFCDNDEVYQDWRVWSSGLNKIYYDPSIDYPAPPGYPDADFFAARSDPQPGTDGYGDVRDLSGFRYYVWIDDKGFAGGRPQRGRNDNHTIGPNNIVDLWDSHNRVTVNSSQAVIEYVEVDHPASNCNSTASCRLDFSADGTQVVDGSGGSDGFGRSLSQMQQNIANWYQYYRRRSLATKSAIAWVLNDSPYFRYGLSVINDWDRLFVEMPPASATTTDYPAHNDGIVSDLFSFDWHGHGTPLRNALRRTGEYYRGNVTGKVSPITSSCQKNFSILFTDGFWNGGSPGVGDRDGDGYSNTVADVAKRYYDLDLRPDLPNEVPADAFDNNTKQHMVTYTVAFGAQGNLVDLDGDGWPDTDVNGNAANWPSENGNWGSPSTNGTTDNIDDLWHAAYNSRGTYVSAKSPKEIVDALSEALANIADRTSSAAAVALNTGSLSTGSRVFQARFETGGWTGQLLAYDIGTDGQVAPIPSWDARDLLDTKSDGFFRNLRKVYTYGAATGREFSPAGLTTQQLDLFDINPDTGNADGLKVERVEYLRGVGENEGTLFRKRDHRLGDLIHSDPTYVGVPPFIYDFDNYRGFINSYRNRTPMVYVGGNDGMMHAFRADNGQEAFAYVPEAVMSRLPQLTSTDYDHRYFVDGPISMGDVNVNGSWRTFLVGTLRAGGQGLYVLDVTDPDSFSASSVVLEFTDGRGSNATYADADLGYTYSTPQIRLMSNGKWAALIGNGYNSSEADGYQGSGQAVLFVVYLDGSGYVKLTTNEGSASTPNGLATPAAIDVDGDFITDYVYAGDLRGNLWKFDLRAASGWESGGSAGVSKLFQTTGGSNMPITSKPTVVKHPNGIGDGVLIWFGTGKYLEKTDETTSIPTQSLYALWDKMDGSMPANLETRSLSTGSPRELGGYSDPDWTSVDGFQIPLSIPGERVVTNPFIRNNVVFFTTLIPDDNACNFGGYGWLLTLDAQEGTPPQRPLFDYNGDGLIDKKDLQDASGNPANTNAVSPTEQFAGIPSSPTFMIDDFSGLPFSFDNPPPANAPRNCGESGPQDLVFTTDSTGGLNVTTTSAGLNVCGRRGWRQTR